MIKVLFICHGNICRSPMAEFVMKHLVEKAGVAEAFEIASAATSREELGNPVYPLAKQKLRQHGIDCAGKRARQLERADGVCYDYLIAMDRNNLRNMARIVGDGAMAKASLLLSFAGNQAEVADPWYTGDFDAAYADILIGCQCLLRKLTEDLPGRKEG